MADDFDYFAEITKPGAAPPKAAEPAASEEYDYFAELSGGNRKPPKPEVINPPRSTKPNVGTDALKWIVDTAKTAGPAIADMVTGNSRRDPSIPEFTGSAPGGPYVTGLPLPQNAAGKIDVIRQSYPNLTATKDEHGNDLIEIEGKKYYVNRPGLSGNDLDDAMVQGLMALPFSRVFGGVLRGATLAGRAVGTGVGAGVGSVVQDLAAGEAGSQQGVDPTQAVTNTLLGGAFEFLSPLAGAIYRKLSTTKGMIDPSTGALSPIAQEMLRAQGINPASITREFAEAFAEQAKRAADPAHAARYAEAQSLPVPVPLTQGQVTRAPIDQMTESLMSKGAYGEMPSTILRRAQQDTEDALRANVDVIQGRMSGGQTTVNEAGQGGVAVSGALNSQLDDAAKGVNTAYDAARASGPAWIPGEQMMGVEMAVRNAAAGFPRERLPGLDSVLRGIGEMGGELGAPFRFPALVSGLEQKRSELSSMVMSADPVERAAAKAALKGFDGEISRMIDSSLIQGDTAAIEAWRGARKLRAALGKTFEGDDLIERLTEKVARGGETTLKVAPEDAANYIFGRSALNTNQFNLTRDLRGLKKQLGDDSPAWNSLREEAFMRLMRSAVGTANEAGTGQKFSGTNFSKAFDKSMRESPEVMRILFGPELNVIQQLRNVAVRGTSKVAGGDNASGTAIAGANMMNKVVNRLTQMPWLGEKGAAALMAIPAARGVLSGVQGVRAYGRTNAAPPVRGMAPGATGAVGSALSEDTVYPVD